MPVYDFDCIVCQDTVKLTVPWETRYDQECEFCGHTMKARLAAPAVHSFPGGVYEHIGPEPVDIGSRARLREECKKNGCFAPGILDGDHYDREI